MVDADVTRESGWSSSQFGGAVAGMSNERWKQWRQWN